jgi:hypothetical protein
LKSWIDINKQYNMPTFAFNNNIFFGQSLHSKSQEIINNKTENFFGRFEIRV